MEEEVDKSRRQDIRNLLLVIATAVTVGIITAGFMLFYYGPVGSYTAKNVLLSPTYTSMLSFNDINPKNGRLEKFILTGIDFSYYDPKKKTVVHSLVNEKAYAQFYNLVEGERSLSAVTDEVRKQFNRLNPSTLTFKVRPESSSDTSKVFLEVDFVNEGDYYRVQLRDNQNAQEAWAYFYHAGIYRQVMQLFTETPP